MEPPQPSKVDPEDGDDIFANLPSFDQIMNEDVKLPEQKEITNVDAIVVKTEGCEEIESVPTLERDSNDAVVPGGKKRKQLDWVRKIETLYLDVMQEGKCIQKIPLGKKERVKFGRDKKADVILYNPSTSILHCAIAVGTPPTVPAMDRGGITLLDLGATNGTYWTPSWPCRRETGRQRVPLKGSVTLKDGFCFRCGESSQSYVVRGLDGSKHNNPNFAKEIDYGDKGLDNSLSKDFGLGTSVKKAGYGAMISKNPFKEGDAEAPAVAVMLPSVRDDSLKKKLLEGGTTFSFHNKRKAEEDNIRYEHEHLRRRDVQELKKKMANPQDALDITTR